MAKSFMFQSRLNPDQGGRRWLGLILGITLLVAGGCATVMAKAVTNASLVDPSRRYPATASVQLLRERPREAYKVIGYLETLGNEYVNSEVFLIESMRTKAREIGADAIVVRDKGRTTVRGADIIQLLEGEAIKF